MKRSKPNQTFGIRKSWGDMSPVTKRIESKTKYNRARVNRENREE